MEKIKLAACYVRVSTDDQIEFSPSAQLRDIREFCNKKGFQLLDEYIFIDEGYSAKTDKRPEFQKMIATAKQKPKPFDVIIVHKFDRFARNREDSAVYKSLLRKRLKIDVYSVKEELSQDKNGMLLEGVLDILAEYYSLNLSDEVKKGQLEKVRNGGNCSKLPIGYKPDGNGGIKIVETEAKIIRKIFDLYLNENLGMHRIGQYLFDNLGIKGEDNIFKNKEYAGTIVRIRRNIKIKRYIFKLQKKGIRNNVIFKNKYLLRGRPYSQSKINYILNNPIYAGYIRRSKDGAFRRKFDDENIMLVKGKHKAIISEDDFKRVKEKLKIQKGKFPGKGSRFKKHWLCGILRCKECDGVMVRLQSRNSIIWNCSNYYHGTHLRSNGISHKIIEQVILEKIKELFTDKLNIDINICSNIDDSFIIHSQIMDIERKLARINDAYINEVYTLEEYKLNKSKLEKEKNELEKMKNNTKKNDKKVAKIKKISKTVYELLTDEKATDDEKYDISHMLFKKITYDKPTNTIEIIYNDLQ